MGEASVSRVVSTTQLRTNELRRSQTLVPVERRELQLLCITPCVVDLPVGAHELVFTARGSEDPAPSSTATVVVHGGEPIVVRHAIGNENVTYRTGYALGLVGVFAGAGLMLIGGLAIALASFGRPSATSPDRASTFYAIGGVVSAIGLTLDVTGIVAAVLNRPRRQAGATTVFSF